MSSTTPTSPLSVVIAPDVLGYSLVDAECGRLLGKWRDGKILVVVTRPLLQIYMKLLSGLGVERPRLETWALWFTASSASQYVDEDSADPSTLSDILLQAAILSRADMIVSREPSSIASHDDVKAVSVEGFLGHTF